MNQTKEILERLGLGNRYLGYRYIIMAVELIMEDADRLQAVNKEIYAAIAEAYQCKHASVERDIRAAISRAWTINPDALKQIAPYPLYDRPTNTEFLELLATHITSA